MLCLNRNRGQSIVIPTSGGDVTITFLGSELRNGVREARLGFTAPREIAIDRSEVRANKESRKDVARGS